VISHRRPGLHRPTRPSVTGCSETVGSVESVAPETTTPPGTWAKEHSDRV